MSLRSFLRSLDKCVAMVRSPLLFWRWKRRVAGDPRLCQQYRRQAAPAQRHRKSYLCRHWGTRMRLLVLSEHYSRLDGLPPAWRDQLLAHRPVPLCTLPLKGGDALQLHLEPSEFGKEGEVGLYLRAADGERLYSLSFSFASAGRLLVGGLQGPRPSIEDGIVKTVGKEMFGLRPKNLLLSALYVISQQMGCRQLLGVTDQAHVCADRLKSSYDQFWQEVQGVVQDRCWYRLPDAEPVRDIAEIKSQRRSEFRRREALREQMAQEIRAAWNAALAAPDTRA